MRREWILACLGLALLTGEASAKWPLYYKCVPYWLRNDKTAEIPYGTTTEADHTMERAGYPMEVSKCATVVETCAYVGYPVGGGAPCKGGSPGPTDGTFGWDYQGRCFKRHVFLWWYRYKPQGFDGAYKTDGPRPCEKRE